MAKTRKEKIGSMQTRAVFDPTSLNEIERTVEVTFATDTPVRMSSWMDGPYDEILSLEDGHVRWERINSGAPLLNNHDRWAGVTGVLGIIERAWTDDKKVGRALVRFSKRQDVEPIFQDVRDGILKGISVGYRVHKYELENPDRKSEDVPVYRAIDWEPFEISLAPIQADINSGVRSTSAELNEVEIVSLKTKIIMKREQIIAMLAKRGISVPANATDEEVTAMLERALSAENTPTPAPQPAAPANPGEETRTAVDAERKRSAEILKAVRAAKLGDEFATPLIENGTSLDHARAAIIEEWAKQDPNKGANAQGRSTVAVDEADKRREGMQDAILLRATPGDATLAAKVKGSEFRGMSLLRMAGDAVEAAGGKIRGLSDSEIARAAMNLGVRAGMMSTSDFPIILGNTINRKLLADYALAERTFLPWTRRESATDFKKMTRARFGEHSGLDKVVEGGEYKSGSIGESKEEYQVEKFGKIIGVTWETLVNDDLSAFNRLPSMIANAAARKQSDIIYAILSANAAMSDTVALFHATHGNLGTAGAISITTLAEGRKLLRQQKGVDKKDFLNLTPSYLVVGPATEALALQYTSSAYVPDVQTQINPFKNLTVIVEPRITGNEWYIMANPSSVDTIEYAFLEGEGELFTEMKEGFEVDGVQVKARMVFGAKAIDWRGMVKMPG